MLRRLDLRRRTLHIGSEEFFLHRKDEVIVPITLAGDVELSANCECAVAGLEENSTPAMTEPKIDDLILGKGIHIGKALVLSTQEVSARLINLNDHSISLQKDTQLGTQELVTAVVHQVTTTKKVITGEIEQLMANLDPFLTD